MAYRAYLEIFLIKTLNKNVIFILTKSDLPYHPTEIIGNPVLVQIIFFIIAKKKQHHHIQSQSDVKFPLR